MTTDPDPVEIVITCPSCGEALQQCEIDDPRSKDEPELCDDCYRECYEFLCCWCEDYEGNAWKHVLLVVFDAEASGVELPGVYRYAQDTYEGLYWVGYLPECHAAGELWGHLCRRCQRKALADCVYQTRCGALVLSVEGC